MTEDSLSYMIDDALLDICEDIKDEYCWIIGDNVFFELIERDKVSYDDVIIAVEQERESIIKNYKEALIKNNEVPSWID